MLNDSTFFLAFDTRFRPGFTGFANECTWSYSGLMLCVFFFLSGFSLLDTAMRNMALSTTLCLLMADCERSSTQVKENEQVNIYIIVLIYLAT